MNGEVYVVVGYFSSSQPPPKDETAWLELGIPGTTNVGRLVPHVRNALRPTGAVIILYGINNFSSDAAATETGFFVSLRVTILSSTLMALTSGDKQHYCPTTHLGLAFHVHSNLKSGRRQRHFHSKS